MNNPSNHHNKPQISPGIVLIFSILAISTASIMIKFAQLEAPSLVIAFYRMLVASLVYLAVAGLFFRKELSHLPVSVFVLSTLSGLFLALHFATWITSLEHTSVTSSAVLVSTTPLWVALASLMLFKEDIRKLYWVGLFCALLGVVIVSLPVSANPGFINDEAVRDFPLMNNGSLLALAGAFFGTGYILIGRQLRKTISMPVYAAVTYTASTLFLFLMVIYTKASLIGHSSNVFILMILIGLIPQVIGHSSYNWALKYIPASVISIALLGEPVGASIQAMLFIGEKPGINEIIGGALILLGIYVATMYGSGSGRRKTVNH